MLLDGVNNTERGPIEIADGNQDFSLLIRPGEAHRVFDEGGVAFTQDSLLLEAAPPWMWTCQGSVPHAPAFQFSCPPPFAKWSSLGSGPDATVGDTDGCGLPQAEWNRALVAMAWGRTSLSTHPPLSHLPSASPQPCQDPDYRDD